jgi:hypothetical protein
MRKLLFSVCLIALALNACSPRSGETSTPNLPLEPTKEPINMPEQPLLEDPNAGREPVFIEEQGLLIRESFPPQIALGLSGNLPSPCHQVRSDVSPPDAENRINVEVYSVVDPTMNCTQVLSPFMETIELGTFPSGHYSVWLNGELAGEFDS